MKRFLPLLMLTGLLFGQDTTIVLENGRTLKGTIVSETDSTYKIMSESWRITDGVYEVFNTFINISKNETVEGKKLSKQDVLYLKSSELKKGVFIEKLDNDIVFQIKGESIYTRFSIDLVEIIETNNRKYYYPFDISTKKDNPSFGQDGLRKDSSKGWSLVRKCCYAYCVFALYFFIINFELPT